MKKIAVCFLFLLVCVGILYGCSTSKEKKIAKKNATSSNTSVATDLNAEKNKTIEKVSASKAQDQAEEIVKDMSLDEKIGQMLIVDLKTFKYNSQLSEKYKKAKPVTKVDKTIQKQFQDYPVGGILLHEDNIQNKEQLATLVADLYACSTYYPLYIAVTEQWGQDSIYEKVPAMGVSCRLNLSEMANKYSYDQIFNIAKSSGKALKKMGFNMVLGPAADVSDGMKNAQYAKYCFSDDADEVSEFVENAIKGFRVGGLCSSVVHFPGIASVVGDYNKEQLDVDYGLSRLRSTNFEPYTAAIDAKTDAIMVSHASVSKVTQNSTPASMSELIVSGIVRDELSFDGLIMTESFSAPVITNRYKPDQAALQAVQAGVDVVVEPANIPLVFSALREGVANRSIDEKALNQAVMRVIKNKIQRGIMKP